MSLNTCILKSAIETKKKKSMPMTDASNQQTDSPSSSPHDSSSGNSIDIQAIAASNRRSQRQRKNVQPNMRSSSLTTTILNENGHANDYLLETTKENDNHQKEKRSLPVIIDKLVFKTSKLNPNLPYWTVTDRQSEWYKLTTPVNQSTSNCNNNNNNNTYQSSLTASYRLLPTIFERKKSNSNLNDQTDELTNTTQLIMKVVMHELDYDMDDNDLEFLNDLNHYMNIEQRRQMTEEEFENAIIILEYYTAEKIRLYLKQQLCEDEDIVCDICLLPDADDENEMVFCERCNACVHQNCYGISVIPNGTWLCKSCSVLRRPACLLCPKLGGPMKCTPSGTIWCHLTCALWLPELKFGDYVKMEPILNLDKIPHARWTLRCIVCSTSEGACVQCAHKNCRTPFHVTCGLSAGYFLDVQQSSSEGTAGLRSQFNAYCLKHSEEARQRSEPESSLNLNTDDDSSCLPSNIPLTVYHRQKLKLDEWTPKSYENFHTFILSSHLNDDCPQDYDESISNKIYNYWKEKRILNKNFPLIKRIDFVLDQRENAELLLAQINNYLKIRNKIRQLQNYCKSTLYTPSSSSLLNQRLENLKLSFSIKTQRHNKSSYYKLIEDSKRCIVALETTYRDALELNTTYLVGKTLEGETMLLPKQLIEQANVITINDDHSIKEEEEGEEEEEGDDEDDTEELDKIHLDIANENKHDEKQTSVKDIIKTPYISQGNVVRCVTGSFD
ncbi:unnamed protein product [Adineta steineri]|uniref:Uncharacterized protein n=1 Tax=Adineta steineri TaxID=433720 RepID=A0A814ARR8_9BILA|nr:unnamed protein product [Adineta steineri]CAF3596508.1 unnamed protein product [Adineta steineri]